MNCCSHKNGFTLVELAVSLMIIGLLLGGVLKGQELLENARITATMKQVREYRSAYATFRSTYGAVPGDMINPQGRLPACATLPCNTSGNGSMLVDPMITNNDTMTARVSNSTTYLAANGEPRNFWLHLLKAGLITGVDPNGAASSPFVPGVEVPRTPFANVVFYANSITFASGGAYGYNSNYSGNVIRLTSASNLALLNASQAAQMDRKMDDGMPYGGDVFADYGGCGVSASSTAKYDEKNEDSRCEIYFTVGL